jgi:chromosome segregation ATPase
MKKDNEELMYNCDFMKIENQELLFKLESTEGELGSAKSAINQYETKVKELHGDLERSEADSKQLQSRYETLLEEARTTLTEKAEKQKKELTATIRKFEGRVEELEEKTFQLELENQKVGELTKREEENKKILARIYELERENMQLMQTSTQKVDKVENDYEKLLWEKKTLEDNLKNTVIKFERTLSGSQQEVERANAKTKETAQQLRDKELQLAKTEESLQRLQFEMNTLKIANQDDKEKLTVLDGKYKTETTKLKADVASMRRQIEEQREQLSSMESLKLVKQTLEEELSSKEKALAVLQDKADSLSEEVFKLTQRVDEMRW